MVPKPFRFFSHRVSGRWTECVRFCFLEAGRCDDFVRPFRGNCDGVPLEEFWQKFLVVARPQKWRDSATRMADLPLYLEGEAWCELTLQMKRKMI